MDGEFRAILLTNYEALGCKIHAKSRNRLVFAIWIVFRA